MCKGLGLALASLTLCVAVHDTCRIMMYLHIIIYLHICNMHDTHVLSTHVYLFTYMHIHVFIYIYVSTSMCICAFIYMYIHLQEGIPAMHKGLGCGITHIMRCHSLYIFNNYIYIYQM